MDARDFARSRKLDSTSREFEKLILAAQIKRNLARVPRSPLRAQFFRERCEALRDGLDGMSSFCQEVCMTGIRQTVQGCYSGFYYKFVKLKLGIGDAIKCGAYQRGN
jgi:hypothetical protein